MNYAEYCRQLESYLCQKNGGHLIRIVGPAFEQVRGWAEQGIPLKIACGGIDRYCERQQAKSGRRRPVRIEFCEADILAMFDDWRRAVGVGLGPSEAQPSPRKASLTSHIERIVARLVAHRDARSPAIERCIERALAELDRLSVESQHARGETRAAIVDRLAVIDRELMIVAAAELDPTAAAAIRRDAEDEIAVFGTRMPSDARAQAAEAAFERLVRDTLGLPTIRFG